MFDLFIIYFFIIGLFLGSFLNLVSDRLHSKKNFIYGRSKCDYCQKDLPAVSLIPVISFIANKGRSYCCQKKISYYYPFSEMLTGFCMVLIYFLFLKNGFDLGYLIFYLVMFGVLIVIFLSDLKYFEIPFVMVVFGSLFSSSYRFFVLQNLTIDNLVWELLSLFLVFLFFASVIILSKGGMGGGDLKLSMMLSLFVGHQNILQSLYLGFLIGGLFSIILLIIRKKSLKSKIPLGPFLILGAVVTLFYPDILSQIISGNFNLFVF